MEEKMQSDQTDESLYQEESYYEHLEDGDIEIAFQGEMMKPLRDQDRFLPIANISKIMKRSIPSNGKIAREAKEIVQECVSEYISFITSEAAERCQSEKRKTINGEDIICAMTALGLDTYVEPLKDFLVKFRDVNKVDVSAAMEAIVGLDDYPSPMFAGNGSTNVSMPTVSGEMVQPMPPLFSSLHYNQEDDAQQIRVTLSNNLLQQNHPSNLQSGN